MIKYILVVGDEPRFVNGLVNGLGNITGNMSIFTAGNARTAMEALRAVSLDLVVIDEKMSVVDGFPLLEYIKREHPGSAVRVMSEQDKACVMKQMADLGIPELSAASPGSAAMS